MFDEFDKRTISSQKEELMSGVGDMKGASEYLGGQGAFDDLLEVMRTGETTEAKRAAFNGMVHGYTLNDESFEKCLPTLDFKRKDIAQVTGLLEMEDMNPRLFAVLVLGKIGKPAIRSLMGVIEGNIELAVKEFAVKTLMASNGEDAVAPLNGLVKKGGDVVKKMGGVFVRFQPIIGVGLLNLKIEH